MRGIAADNVFINNSDWARVEKLSELRKVVLLEALAFMRQSLTRDPALVIDPSPLDSAAANLVDEMRKPIPCPTCGNECKK